MIDIRTNSGEESEDIKELRDKLRVQLCIPTRLLGIDGTVLDTVSMNLSEGGIFIVTENPPTPGDSCWVEIVSLEGKEVLRGKVDVRWCLSEPVGKFPCGFGGRFIKVELQSPDSIRAVVQSALRRESVLVHIKNLGNPEKLARDISDIQNITIPEDMQPFISEYGKHGERDGFIWRWVYQGLRLTALSSVDSVLWDEVQVIKMLGVMFDVMLDDAADNIQDKELVEQLLLIPFEGSFINKQKISSQHVNYLEFTLMLWNEIKERMQKLPRYSEFECLMEFDYRQLLNCMRYALLVNNDPRCLNLAEHDLYQPHNMHMMISSTIDLMGSSVFDTGEIGLLREVTWNAQVMGRIGNAVTTWQRELKDKDFTSGIFAMAITNGVLSYEDLLDPDENKLEDCLLASQLEEKMLLQWGKHLENITTLASRIRTIDIGSLINGLERLIGIHLGSRGFK
jgi:hypothetical protein